VVWTPISRTSTLPSSSRLATVAAMMSIVPALSNSSSASSAWPAAVASLKAATTSV
jgi:hypothetical protein